MSSVPHNLLVISDLHLGEDIGTRLGAVGHPRVALTERQLVSFLDHHAEARIDGRPWRLVINGDMVDFLAMIVMPADAGVLVGLDEDDHWYGLGTTRAAAQVKLARVVARHADVFRALARFVGAGNKIAIVIGNHDVEFHWPEAQAQLRDALSRFAPEAAFNDETVSFHPWFFYEDGVWVEHGHLYDPYCATEDVLDPFTDDGRDIAPSLSAFAMRYVNNHFAPHAGHDEPWGFLGYLSWFLGQGSARMQRILAAFGQMTRRLLAASARAGSGATRRRERRRRHLARLRELAQRHRLPASAIESVDALRRRPVVVDRIRVVRALMLDRLLVSLLVAVTVASVLLVLPWALAAAVTALLVIGLGVVHHRLANAREASVSTRRLARIARRIREAVHARIVVFGHTHDPVARRDDDGWTFNTGSWVPDDRHGVDRAFTHLRVVRRADGTEIAELRQWRDNRSEVLPAA